MVPADLSAPSDTLPASPPPPADVTPPAVEETEPVAPSIPSEASPSAARSSIDLEREWDPVGTLFGISVANLGDNDGDGEEELAIAAPVAWTDRGRTGAVLVVGAKSRKLLRLLKGSEHGEFFGWTIGVASIGTRTVLVTEDRDGRVQGFDAASGIPIPDAPKLQPEGTARLDHDGDGVLDVLREPKEGNREIELVSGLEGAVLRKLPIEISWSKYPRLDSVAVDLDGDSHKDLVVVCPDFEAGTSSLHFFSGRELEVRRVVALGRTHDPYGHPDRIWRHLFTCGDLNRDGKEDVLAAAIPFLDESLTCYSGADGSILWNEVGVVEAERPSIVPLRDMDGDSVNEILCGKVLYMSWGVQYGPGVVFILSGKSGQILSTFDERHYPEISLASFLAPAGK